VLGALLIGLVLGLSGYIRVASRLWEDLRGGRINVPEDRVLVADRSVGLWSGCLEMQVLETSQGSLLVLILSGSSSLVRILSRSVVLILGMHTGLLGHHRGVRRWHMLGLLSSVILGANLGRVQNWVMLLRHLIALLCGWNLLHGWTCLDLVDALLGELGLGRNIGTGLGKIGEQSRRSRSHLGHRLRLPVLSIRGLLGRGGGQVGGERIWWQRGWARDDGGAA
jgi:hypothetical protein